MNTSGQQILADQCWELLATTAIGRLALSVRALPVIMPVQYYLDGRKLAVCLGHHQLPERSLNEVIIAFAADAIDPVTRSGWSVQVQGRSVIPQRLNVDMNCGWPTAGQVALIEPASISGYRVHLCPFIDTLLTSRQTPRHCDLRRFTLQRSRRARLGPGLRPGPRRQARSDDSVVQPVSGRWPVSCGGS